MIKPNTPMIDCRSKAEYISGHIQGSTHIPANELFSRMHELPKRIQAISLCGDEESLQEARSFLESRGYQVIETLLWTDELVQIMKQHNVWEEGISSQQLWQAAPFFKRFINEFQPQLNMPSGRGLDIACGAGRDMIYLAQNGWQMTGIDHHEDALRRVNGLAQVNQVSVDTLQLDLETGENPFTIFEPESFDLICVARYLHRPLFPYIKDLLAPNGIILYQTFLEGCERPRNPNYILKHNELAQVFSDFEMVCDEVEYLEDGRPVSSFLACKNHR